MTESDSHPRRPLWPIVLWLGAPAALLALAGLAWFGLVNRERRIESAGIEQFRAGLTQAELWELLGGAPNYEQRAFGLVEGLDRFATNQFTARTELERRGYRVYRFQQWQTPRLTVVVVSVPATGLACRYFPGGHDVGLYDRLWFIVSGKARRPPPIEAIPETSAPSATP